MVLDYKLFMGVSVQLKDVENAETKASEIASLSAVKNVWPVERYGIPEDELKWAGNPTRGNGLLSKRANETATTHAPHVMTQVDKLRAKGITGKGVKVAVIDSGVSLICPASLKAHVADLVCAG